MAKTPGGKRSKAQTLETLMRIDITEDNFRKLEELAIAPFEFHSRRDGMVSIEVPGVLYERLCAIHQVPRY